MNNFYPAISVRHSAFTYGFATGIDFLNNVIAFRRKGQNQIHWTMPISETCSYVLSIEIFSHDISNTYWHACSK